MIKDMGKELIIGFVFLGGVALAVATVETIPFVAGIGAVASLGAGLYQAVSAAQQSKTAREEESSHVASRRAS